MMRWPNNKWFKILTKWFAIPLCSIFVLLLIMSSAFWIIGRVWVPREISHIKDKGGFLSWDDIEATIPKGPNVPEGTKLLEEAFKDLSLAWLHDDKRNLIPIEGSGSSLEPNEKIPLEVNEAIAERLRDVQFILAKIRKAILLGACPFERYDHYNRKAAILISDIYSSYRGTARLLALSAFHKSINGNGNGAAEEIITGLKLCSQADANPSTISSLVRIACGNIMVDQLENVLARTDPNRKALESILAALEEEEKFSMVRGLNGDRFNAIQMYNDTGRVEFVEMMTILFDGFYEYLTRTIMREFGVGEEDSMFLRARQLSLSAIYPFCRGWILMNEAKQLQLLGSNIDRWQIDWDSFQKAGSIVKDTSRFYALAKSFCSIDYTQKAIELGYIAQIRSARVGVYIELYQQEHGYLPNDLSELIPDSISEIPRNPFTQRVLSSNRHEDLLETYSDTPDKMRYWGGDGKFHQLSFRNYEKEMTMDIWTCTMHSQVKIAKPGKCPICLIDLIKTENP